MSGRSARRHSGSSVTHNSPVCVTVCVCVFVYMLVKLQPQNLSTPPDPLQSLRPRVPGQHLMSPGPANSFNLLLIPQADRAD